MKFCSKNLLLFVALSSFLISSCAPTYTYFTKDLHDQQQWSEEDLKRVQFYTSSEIILTRLLTAGETMISGGKIIVKNGERYEKVVIPTGTPGVMIMMPAEDRMAISFETKNNESFLMFGPNPEYNNRFALLAQDWEKDQGQVHYGDKLYTVDAAYAYACLMVDMRKESERQYTTKSVMGRSVE